jgi:AcrR family transcriptional regulator
MAERSRERASEGAVGGRPYDAPRRREQVERTRERIVAAGSELVHEFATWDWHALTFRAVAGRAGVGERTVYRHFPTERHLHDAVMQRLEQEAGVSYEELTLADLTAVTERVFRSRVSFSAGASISVPDDPTFVAADERRRRALLEAVSAGAPNWSDSQQRAVAALLDVLWNLPTYERLVGAWQLPAADAELAISWLIETLASQVNNGEPPPTA